MSYVSIMHRDGKIDRVWGEKKRDKMIGQGWQEIATIGGWNMSVATKDISKDRLIYGIYESDVEQVIIDMIRDDALDYTPNDTQRAEIHRLISNQDFGADYEKIQLLVDHVMYNKST